MHETNSGAEVINNMVRTTMLLFQSCSRCSVKVTLNHIVIITMRISSRSLKKKKKKKKNCNHYPTSTLKY